MAPTGHIPAVPRNRSRSPCAHTNNNIVNIMYIVIIKYYNYNYDYYYYNYDRGRVHNSRLFGGRVSDGARFCKTPPRPKRLLGPRGPTATRPVAARGQVANGLRDI